MARREKTSTKLTSPCREHNAPSIQRCRSCGAGVCDDCFRFTLDQRPACVRCAYEASTRSKRRVSLAVVFLTFAGGIWVWLARRFSLWAESPFTLGLGVVATLVVAGFIAASARDKSAGDVAARDRDDYEPTDDPAHPYRAGARRVLLAMSPRISGKATAAVVLVSLVTAAVLVPASMRLPRWVEVELVLGAWWGVMAATIAVLLHRGFRLQDDLVYFAPWDRPGPPSGQVVPAKSSGGSMWGALDGWGSFDGEGCIAILLVAVVLGGAFGAAWLMVEIALPLVFFVLYALLMRAIRRAATDRRGCEGKLGPSLGWGALWATIYVLPLAAITYVVHATHR